MFHTLSIRQYYTEIKEFRHDKQLREWRPKITLVGLHIVLMKKMIFFLFTNCNVISMICCGFQRCCWLLLCIIYEVEEQYQFHWSYQNDFPHLFELNSLFLQLFFSFSRTNMFSNNKITLLALQFFFIVFYLTKFISSNIISFNLKNKHEWYTNVKDRKKEWRKMCSHMKRNVLYKSRFNIHISK